MNRRLEILFLATVLMGGFATNASATPIQWTGPGSNGHWYEAVAVRGGIQWTAADTAAQAAGGHLATVTSTGENQFLFSLINSNSQFWLFQGCCNTYWGPFIGGFWNYNTNQWAWVTGETWSLTPPWDNWQSAPGVEPYVHFHGTSQFEAKWNDIYSGYAVPGYIVEWDSNPLSTSTPEPASITLLGLGLVGVACARRRRRS